MNELDAPMWRAGEHPKSSTQSAVLEVFDGTPAWSDVRQLHLDGLQTRTRFRQRLVKPALPVGPHTAALDGHGSAQLLSDLHSRSRSDGSGAAEFRRTSRPDPLRVATPPVSDDA